VFDKNYSGVTQVCPAHNNNYSTEGFKTDGPLYIVIHNTGNADATAIAGNIVEFQKACCRYVSAHYIVGLDKIGAVHVIQMVSEKYIAHHVGEHIALNGHSIDNTNSIGIEVVGQGDLTGWPSTSIYAAVGDLVKDIVRRAKASGREIEVDRDHIVGHEEVSTAYKWDPGPFWDWQQFMGIYLDGAYTPAAQLTASREKTTNAVSLSVIARYNNRTHYSFDLSEDEGPYLPVSEIKPVPNSANSKSQNPATFNLVTYTPPPPERPIEYCYRATALRNNTAYVNPSGEACVIVGPIGNGYDLPRRDSAIVLQSAYPIVKPGEDVTLIFTLRNTGILSWKTNGRYVLINTGGESFSLPTQLIVSNTILAYEDITWELQFKAPTKTGAYSTHWRMAHIDTEAGSVALFGKEVGYIVTVVPGGNSSDLGQIIRQIIDQALKAVTEPLEKFLADLQRQIEEEIDRRTPWWVKCWLSLVGPGIVAPSIALWEQRRRKR